MLFSSSLLVTLPHSLPLSPLWITASPPHFPFSLLFTCLASSGHVFTYFSSLVGSFVTSVSKKTPFLLQDKGLVHFQENANVMFE